MLKSAGVFSALLALEVKIKTSSQRIKPNLQKTLEYITKPTMWKDKITSKMSAAVHELPKSVFDLKLFLQSNQPG